MVLRSVLLLAAACSATFPAAAAACRATSGPTLVPAVELFTSEGCSSCPPADQWLSGLKQAAAAGRVVPQAFHVGYWDYIGWIDRFASPTHTSRQRQLAAANGLTSIYTPQIVVNGRDARDYERTLALASGQPAGATLSLERSAPDLVEAQVTPTVPGAWSAYWTVTEHGHRSKVSAGENAGELLQHDFVVRQYVPAGQYQGAQKLRLRPLPQDAAHPQQVNLVVVHARTGQPLQAISLRCSG